MIKKYVVAPTYGIARLYAMQKEVAFGSLYVICERFDLNRLRGLRGISIVILNSSECQPEIVDFIRVMQSKSLIKMEFENV